MLTKLLLALFVGLAGCCSTPTSCRKPIVDPSLPTDADVRNACAAAGARLAEIHCKEARPDFTEFCVATMDAGVPLHPTCLAAIQTCGDVDEHCR